MKANRRALEDADAVSHVLGVFLMMPVILMLISMMMFNMQGSINKLGRAQIDFEVMFDNIDDADFSIYYNRTQSVDNIIWSDDFEKTKLQWDPALYGLGSDISVFHGLHYQNGGHSIKLTTGTNIGDFSGISKPFPGQAYGMVSIEIAFTLSKDETYKVFSISQDNDFNNASIRLDFEIRK